MTLVSFILKLLTAPVLVVVLLALVLVLFIPRILMIFACVRKRVRPSMSGGAPPRWVLLSGIFLIFLAYGGLLLFIVGGNHSPVVKITSIIGGAGIAMSIAHWLSSLFAPPLSQAHFDRAMAEQTEIIKAGNAQVVAAVQEGNAQVVTALQEGNTQVVAALSELTQQVSELSGDIRALIEALPRDAGGSTRPGETDD